MQRCRRIWAWYSLWKSSLSMAFSYVSQIHDKLRHYEKHSPTPVLHSAACLAEDVRTIFPSRIPSQLEINVCDKDTLFIKRCGTSLESGWFFFCPPFPPKNTKSAGRGASERPAGGRWEGTTAPAEHSSPQGLNSHCCHKVSGSFVQVPLALS